jgi:hypothetical protein
MDLSPRRTKQGRVEMVRGIFVSIALVVWGLPNIGLSATPCGSNPAKVSGVLISNQIVTNKDNVFQCEISGMIGNVAPAIRIGANRSDYFVVVPGGPSFLWIIRVLSQGTKDRFKKAGVELNPGEVYVWETKGKKVFPPTDLKEIKYLCTLDNPTLSDDELIMLFLKSASPDKDKRRLIPVPGLSPGCH